MIMKIWVDDVRPIPDNDYILAKSTNEAISIIQECEEKIRKTGEVPSEQNIVIDLDHDSGDFYKDGGDYIRVLDWLEATNRKYSIRLHTMNSVGRRNMMNIIKKIIGNCFIKKNRHIIKVWRFLYKKRLIVFLFYVIVKTLTKCKIDYIINRRKQNWAFLIN